MSAISGKRIFAASAVALSLLASPANAESCRVGAVRDLFAYEGQTQIVLDVEAAMARAQATHGVIPAKAAQDITSKARVELIPQVQFDAAYSIVNHRMVALLNVWRGSLSDAGDQYVHFGATTVDIYGTATVIQIDRSLQTLDGCMVNAIGTMSSLAAAHIGTPMIGRTLGQHAQPITFGKKVSAWIGEYARHRERIAELRARVIRSASLKGPVGNYSGLGDQAIEVERSFAKELGLDGSELADWSGTRDVIAEYGMVLGLIARSHQRIGQELFLLQGTDIGEVREAQRTGVVGSSSMPHKRNPRAPERLVHAGRIIPRLAEVLGDDVVNLFERDNTSRLTPIIEDISIASVDAARRLNSLLAGLEVDEARLLSNIDRTRGFAMSQRVALALSQHMRRKDAEQLTKAVIADAVRADIDFIDALLADPKVTAHLDQAQLTRLLDPTIIGAPAIEQVEQIIAEAQADGASQ
ncbi:MAG: lyase family protein [Erythrobacter sp.]